MKTPTVISAAVAALTLGIAAIAAAKPDDGEAPHVVYQATRTDRLYGVTFVGDSGIAVGDAGRIMRTADGGRSWTAEASPTPLTFFNVASSGTREIAVGQLGLIAIKTADGPWRQVDSGSEMRLLNVDVNRNGLAVVVGAFGTLLRSTDGGESWTSIAPEWALLYDSGSGDTALLRDEPTNYVVKVFDDDRIIIGGEYGQLIESTDRGASWRVIYRHPEEEGGVAPTLFEVVFHGELGYAVGQAGLVLRSDDSGRKWRAMPTPIGASLFAVDAIDSDKVVAVGQRAAIVSTDAGASWHPLGVLDFSLNWYSGIGHGRSTGDQVAIVGHAARIVAISPFR